MARVRELTLLAVLLLAACTGCARAVNGVPAGMPTPALSISQTVRQAMADLAEAGALQYTGSVITPQNITVGLTLTVTADGLIDGTLSVTGQQAAVLVISGVAYLNGPAAFWAALTAQTDNANPTVNGNWVQVTDDLLGLPLAQLLTPAKLAAWFDQEADQIAGPPLSQRPTVILNGAPAVQIVSGADTVYLAPGAPQGVVRVDLQATNGTARDLSLDVTDSSPTTANIYANLAAQSGGLATAIDPSLNVTGGTQKWGTCSTAGCSVTVTVTNNGYGPTKIEVNGTWQGDGTAVGSCQAIVGPVAPSQSAQATCTDNSSAWRTFYQHANATAGNHPYQVDWTAAALATEPDLRGLTSDALAASKPVAVNAGRDPGRYAVYRLNYQDSTATPQVWKYGVSVATSWQATARAQLAACVSASRTSCTMDLATSADSQAGADALATQLVAKARSTAGQCPPGQWAFCG
ncbi:MAG TPA: hypothetical protein VHW44_03015 [Pseudonocardiaceae bacterium]|jgi:hypothetical protein|nr:hypothetical protein [Pseudonocardiaceae bacterium]